LAQSSPLADLIASQRSRSRVKRPEALQVCVRPLLKPGVAILDVGAGRSPMIAPEHRPPGCRAVGLDISEDELRSAAPGAYEHTMAHDITKPLPVGELFDLVLS